MQHSRDLKGDHRFNDRTLDFLPRPCGLLFAQIIILQLPHYPLTELVQHLDRHKYREVIKKSELGRETRRSELNMVRGNLWERFLRVKALALSLLKRAVIYSTIFGYVIATTISDICPEREPIIWTVPGRFGGVLG